MTEHIIVLADIHANEAALLAVMQHAREHYDRRDGLRVWFLGDLFGRGPDAARTWVRWMTYRIEVCVVGNHDWGLIGRFTHILGVRDILFSDDDWSMLIHHRRELASLGLMDLNGDQPDGGEVVTTIQRWPVVCQPLPGTYLSHGGATIEPAPNTEIHTILQTMIVDGYVKDTTDAVATLATMRLLANTMPEMQGVPPQLVLVGHYHQRTLYRAALAEPWEHPLQVDYAYPLYATAATPALVSPGSVGFSRDSTNRHPSYAVIGLNDGQPETITFHIVPYDRDRVRLAMRERNYPETVVSRL